MKGRSKKEVSEKTIGIITGIALALAAVGIISAISVSSAHRSGGTAGSMMGTMGGGAMGGMGMMHSMMMGGGMGMMDDNHMAGCPMMTGNEDLADNEDCMSMMNSGMYGMTEEEIGEMMQDMDKDGDGFCDYCGMPVEMCREMMN